MGDCEDWKEGRKKGRRRGREGRKRKGRKDSLASSPLGGRFCRGDVISSPRSKPSFFKRNSKELGDGSVGKVLVRQVWNPEFDPPEPM